MSIVESISLIGQASGLTDEGTEEAYEAIIGNAAHAWLPEFGLVLIAITLILALFFLWKNTSIVLRSKIICTITSIAWSAVFVSIEALLAFLAQTQHVTGAQALFAVASATACGGGISAIIARARLAFLNKRSTSPYEEPTSLPANTYITRIIHELANLLCCILSILGASVLCFIFLEAPSNTSFASIPDVYLSCELSVIIGVIVGCWLICQRRPIGLAIPLVISLVYGAAEYYVEQFKAAAILPSDLRNIGTGMNVAGGYEYNLTSTLLFLIVLLCVALGLIVWLKDPLSSFLSPKEASAHIANRTASQNIESNYHRVKNVLVALLSLVLGIQILSTPLKSAMETNWHEEGIEFNFWSLHRSFDEYGIIPSFIASIQLEDLDEPKGYSKIRAAQLQTGLAKLYDKYIESTPERQAAQTQFADIKPNVVFIMNEAFSDLSFLGELGVGYKGPEYLHELNAIAKGKTNVSVYGGGTCNSEFEALTETSLGYVGGGINPYSIYDLSQIESLPKQFKALGYTAYGIHPEDAANWRRNEVYPKLGFDDFITITSFEDAELFREHVRDYETYDMAISKIVASDEPLFIFDLTMMGHGGYGSGLVSAEDSVNYDFTGNGILAEGDGDTPNEYLSSIRMSDRDIQYLINELSTLEEPTIVIFFGDHQPGFSWWFQDKFADDSSDIAYQESLYQTDYFIWANYSIAGSAWSDQEGASSNTVLYDEAMSPANLMGWTKTFIGAPLTEYEKASYMSRWWVQSNNIYGYIDSTDTWHPMDETNTLAGESTYDDGLQIINDASETGLPSFDTSNNMPWQEAVMVNVMKWITYMNFIELIH